MSSCDPNPKEGEGGNTIEKDSTQNQATKIVNRDFTVNIHMVGEPSNYNVVLAIDAIATAILAPNVHMQLLERDQQTLEFLPYLAKALPIIENKPDGTMYLTYEIRPEATWDNGTPILASDVAFSIKAIKTPTVNAASLRGYFDFVEDVIIDENNNRRFTFVCNKPYFIAKDVTGSFHVLPEYFYDPQGYLAEFTVAELHDETQQSTLLKNVKLQNFGAAFNTEFSKKAEKISGAGAYRVAEINTNQNVVLERKADWWGDQVDVPYIAANPKRIVFKVIPDENSSIAVLKDKELDVMTLINAQKFLELKENKMIVDDYNFHTPNTFGYYYIGMNMKNPKLEDVRVRHALSHLIDKEAVVRDLKDGFGTVTNGPVNPAKPYYDKNIPVVPFDLEAAKKLLQEAGWTDTDGNNVLDKIIDGKKTELALKIVYLQSNSFYKNLATNFKYEAERIGVKIETRGLERNVLTRAIENRTYELKCLGWGGVPMPDDFTQVWHSKSMVDGSNYVGFGSPESDQLIDQIRITTDETERNKMYIELQKKITEQHPYIFLFSQQSCTVINKKFTNTHVSSVRPGYLVRLFELND